MFPQHVLDAKAKQIADDAKQALIMGIVGVFCFGFILGIIAVRKANSAHEAINVYEVGLDYRGLATGAKVLGIIDIVAWVFVLIARIMLLATSG